MTATISFSWAPIPGIWPLRPTGWWKTTAGIVVAENETVTAELPLEIAGIMTDQPLEQVNEALEQAKAAARTQGANPGIDPFMTLSFMALPVIPTLRLTTRGVIDVVTQRYV